MSSNDESVNNLPKNKKKTPIRKRLLDLLFLLIAIASVGILLYIPVSQLIHHRAAQGEAINFAESAAELSEEDRKERVRLAEAYNYGLAGESMDIVDPYSDQEVQEGNEHYAWMLEVDYQIGVVHIPKIDQMIPIRAGTSDSVLDRGVGHMQGTSLPIGGTSTHSVITAHRGLPQNRLFTDLDQMEIGDRFYIETIAGKLAYDVTEIQVIEPYELDALEIREGEDIVTLLTCTPYGVNSHRLLVIGERGEITPEEEIAETGIPKKIIILFAISGLVIITLLIILFKPKKNNKNKGK